MLLYLSCLDCSVVVRDDLDAMLLADVEVVDAVGGGRVHEACQRWQQ